MFIVDAEGDDNASNVSVDDCDNVVIVGVDDCDDVVIVIVDVDVELRNKSEFSLKCLLFPQAHLEVVGSQWVKQNSLKLFRNRSFMTLFFEVNGFSRIF